MHQARLIIPHHPSRLTRHFDHVLAQLPHSWKVPRVLRLLLHHTLKPLELPSKITPLGLPKRGQAPPPPIDCMNSRKRHQHGPKALHSLPCVLHARQGGITKDTAFHKAHEVKRRPYHRSIFAQVVDGRDGHGRILQGLEDAILPFHCVRRGHLDQRRLLPQHETLTRGLQREEKGRVALTAFELGGIDLEGRQQGGRRGGRRTQECRGKDLLQVPL
jgi:hypothetical protein